MKALEQNDFYKYRFLSSLSISPNGKDAALVAASVNEEKNSYDGNIWLYRDGIFSRFTAMDSERSFFWDTDDVILFPGMRSDADKKRAEAGEQFTSFYAISTKGGEALKAFELPFAAGKLERLEGEKYVVSGSISVDCPDYYKLDKEGRDAADKARRDDRDYEVCDETPFWFNGAGFVNGSRSALFIFDRASGEVERITGPRFDAESYVILGDEIIYTGNEKEYKSSIKSGFYAYNWKTGESRTVRDDMKYSCSYIGKLDGRLVSLMSDNLSYGINQDPEFYFMDPVTGEETLLYGPVSVGNSTGSDCRLGHGRSIKEAGDKLYFVETRRNAAVLCSLDSNGVKTDVWNTEGAVDDFDVSDDEKNILLNRITADTLEEIYDLEGNRLSDFNSEPLKDTYVALPRKLTVDSRGIDIDGWVLYPFGYEEGKKYPAVLDIHGGPKTVYGEVFYHEMQYWASKGYFVFFCNPTGGDGRGDEFADIRGKYGTIDYENIMDFTDAVLDAYPDIDRDKVCVTGGSYGGYMSNWIIGHTDRFCCCATQRSISNWISFNGVSDIGEWFGTDQCAGNIYDQVEKLWWHSPLKYADRVVTPTLFIHSDEDYRCPLEQGIQLYSAIRNRDVEARMCIFHGENHELSRGGKPLHRSRRLKEITDWFERFAR